jgi:hypothetical protein
MTKQMKKWKPTVSFAVLLLIATVIWMAGCDTDDEEKDSDADAGMPVFTEVDIRFEAAEELTKTWCLESQRVVAGFDETTLPDDMILNDLYEERDDWSSRKSQVDADEDPPVEIRVWIEPYCDVELPAPTDLSERIYCKMPNQDRISGILEITPANEPGTCKSRNEAVFEWALDQLTSEERDAYERSGHQITFLEDEVVGTGGQWLGLTADFELSADGTSYEIGSPSLQSAFNPDDPDNQTLEGVHYCKLVTPAQALYWVLYRGFKDDPGICEAPQGEVCPDPDATPTGSCIFYFPIPGTGVGQTFCEEYRGPNWTVEAGQEKCDPRDSSDFKPLSCADRKDETDLIDDDGVFKGTCVVSCGDDERVWKIYSDPPPEAGIDDISGFCSMGWVPAE